MLPQLISVRGRRVWMVIVAVLAIALAVARLDSPRRARAALRPHLTDEQLMNRMAEEWCRLHPAHGGSTSAVAADTFTVRSVIFDTDGNLSTQIDTAKVLVGQSIMWKWVNGSHTTTSGSPGDATAGSHWDHAINNLNAPNMEFTVTFDTAGTYPFFCRPHGQLYNMKGVVVVSTNPVSVPPRPGERGLVGFVAAPWPNPTRAGASFRFALRQPGRARAEVFDASGRVVATPLDRDLAPGAYQAVWDGRARGGVAPAGVYYLRLSVPGLSQSRKIVIQR